MRSLWFCGLLALCGSALEAKPCSQLLDNLNRFQSVRAVIVGDVMLDQVTYVIHRNRISPESTTAQDYLWHSENYYIGGAGNVALNAKALGAEAFLFGVGGRDEAGYRLDKLIHLQRLALQFDRAGLIFVDKRMTTVKSRTLRFDNSEHLQRISREITDPIDDETSEEILARIQQRKPHVIVLSDYAKGVVTEDLAQRVIAWAAQNDSIVVVDPKGKNFDKYRGAHLIKPNQKELHDLLGREVSLEDLPDALRDLKKKYKLQMSLVTLGHAGMIGIDQDDRLIEQPSLARQVVDVTGAGDSTTAALALSLASGLPLRRALFISSHAASVAISKMGTHAVTKDEILDDSKVRK